MPEFWSAVAAITGIVQALSAIVLIRATLRYVGLTAELSNSTRAQLEESRLARQALGEADRARLYTVIQRLMFALRDLSTQEPVSTPAGAMVLWSADDERTLLDTTLRVAPGLHSEANEAALMMRALRLKTPHSPVGGGGDLSAQVGREKDTASLYKRAWELLVYMQDVIFPQSGQQQPWRTVVPGTD